MGCVWVCVFFLIGIWFTFHKFTRVFVAIQLFAFRKERQKNIEATATQAQKHSTNTTDPERLMNNRVGLAQSNEISSVNEDLVICSDFVKFARLEIFRFGFFSFLFFSHFFPLIAPAFHIHLSYIRFFTTLAEKNNINKQRIKVKQSFFLMWREKKRNSALWCNRQNARPISLKLCSLYKRQTQRGIEWNKREELFDIEYLFLFDFLFMRRLVFFLSHHFIKLGELGIKQASARELNQCSILIVQFILVNYWFVVYFLFVSFLL